MLDLVGNPEDQFSRVAAHIAIQSCNCCQTQAPCLHSETEKYDNFSLNIRNREFFVCFVEIIKLFNLATFVILRDLVTPRLNMLKSRLNALR